MSYRAGKVLTLGGDSNIVERLQTSGPGSLNIPTGRIGETGNELTVSVERDIPDLSYDLKSYAMDLSTEAMICRRDVNAMADGDILTFADAKPLDLIAPIKGAGSSKTSVRGVIWPYLTLESAAYRFGVGQNSTQTFTFRGDSQYGVMGTPYAKEFDFDDVPTFTFDHTAVKTVEVGADVYAYNVTIYYADGACKRLYHGHDYSNTSGGFTILDPSIAAAGDMVAVVYGSATSATFPQTIHSTASMLPGAIKGKHINVYVGTAPIRTFSATTANADATLTAAGGAFTSADVGAAISGTNIPAGTVIGAVTDGTHIELADANGDPVLATGSGTITATLAPQLVRWRGVQSIELTWRVQLEVDDELGNIHHVGWDYDVPELSGTISVKPEDPEYLFDLWQQVGGAADGETANLTADVPLEVRVTIKHPKTGAVLKTFRVQDARIQPPAHQARAKQKFETSFPFSSDSGLLEIAKGAWAA